MHNLRSGRFISATRARRCARLRLGQPFGALAHGLGAPAGGPFGIRGLAGPGRHEGRPWTSVRLCRGRSAPGGRWSRPRRPSRPRSWRAPRLGRALIVKNRCADRLGLRAGSKRLRLGPLRRVVVLMIGLLLRVRAGSVPRRSALGEVCKPSRPSTPGGAKIKSGGYPSTCSGARRGSGIAPEIACPVAPVLSRFAQAPRVF